MARRLFNIAAVLSLVLCVTATALWIADSDLSTRFVRYGSTWELACRTGRLWLENAPNTSASESELHQAEVRQALEKEPWGSPRYRKAVDELHGIQKAREAESRSQKPAPSPHVEHSLPLWLAALMGTILPMVWLTLAENRRVFWLKLRSIPQHHRLARRRLFAIASAFSLLLCAGMVVLWVRSYSRSEALHRISTRPDGSDRILSVWSWHGSIYLWHSLVWQPPPPPRRPRWRVESTPTLRATFATNFQVASSSRSSRMSVQRTGIWDARFAGFEFGGHHARNTGNSPEIGTYTMIQQFWGAVVPYWAVFVMLAASPTMWVLVRARAILRSRAGRVGLCPTCGYDLRASPERCPECGTPIRDHPAGGGCESEPVGSGGRIRM